MRWNRRNFQLHRRLCMRVGEGRKWRWDSGTPIIKKVLKIQIFFLTITVMVKLRSCDKQKKIVIKHFLLFKVAMSKNNCRDDVDPRFAIVFKQLTNPMSLGSSGKKLWLILCSFRKASYNICRQDSSSQWHRLICIWSYF